ncbi:MAG TPA: M20/M25/M40 family metallo-hydrolase [Nitrospirota bacterium]
MKRASLCLFLSFVLLSPAALRAQETYVHHAMRITFSPSDHRLTAVDSITLPEDAPREITFALHSGLKPSSSTPLVRIEKQSEKPGPAPLELFKAVLPPGLHAFTLSYEGRIFHPVEQAVKESARGVQETPGIISPDGVYLSGGSSWYPDFGTGLVTFDLEVKLPGGWDAVSQGERTLHDKRKNATSARWNAPEPQDSIFIIAAPFTEYDKPAGGVQAMVFLRSPDPGLAQKYLVATATYIDLYSRLIGPYPYKKFALVENFWETGFGMPSFTLLGPAVLRLPFIVNTSYPHEILHNWWGNSVFPVYEKGNWSEGITAYMADHLMKELQNAGADYRMTTLQKYADYVAGNRDFPLTEFRSRHDPATEAVGYGKSLMFFHMLRRELGDDTFKSGLREFYKKNKFRFASFDDLRASFEAVSGKDLKAEFGQWVDRVGAPQLVADSPAVGPGKGGYLLTAMLEQTQPGDAYRLHVPVAVTMEGQEQALETTVEMHEKRLRLMIPAPARPLRLDIDPEFDLFRRLSREETPPAISQALGAKKMLIILPSADGEKLLSAYRGLADAIGRSGPDEVEVKSDSEVKKLPFDRAVVILGWENRFRASAISALAGYDVAFQTGALRIEKTEIPRQNHSVVLTARLPENKDMAIMFVASDAPEAMDGLGRKLPHYHKYSYLAFEGPEPANTAKGRWPVIDSPLTLFVPAADGNIKKVEMGRLPQREPLASLAPVFSKERMMNAISFLARSDLKGRAIGTPEIDRAAEYIAEQFRQAGLKPGGDEGRYFEEWQDPRTKIRMKNVIGVLPGRRQEWAGQSVVIGAHYDHLGLGMSIGRTEDRGKVHPGADDNASGVSVLLELARALKDTLNPDRSVVFIAFTGEEEGKLGSKHYAANEKLFPVDKCIGMINLDTVGRLGKRKLLVLDAGSAKEWVHIFRGAGFVTGVELETVSTELDSSDQKSFEEAAVPAVQLFSGPHADYHRPSDTVEKIDSEGLVKTASVAKEVVEYLSAREGPLSSALRPGRSGETAPRTERRVSLGTIPDYAYAGKGVRLSGTVQGSPAEKAGLKEGDVIIRINTAGLGGLKDLSDILKTLTPGDRVSITYLRDGRQRKTGAVLQER